MVISLLVGAAFSNISCAKREKVIKIGAILPLTGDIAEYGTRCKTGIDMAVEEINAVGGIKGRKIQMIYEDSKGLPKEGVAGLQKLITVDKVPAVIGAVASSVTMAMVPSATNAKVVLFSPASSSPKLSGISKFFFRDWPSDVLEARVLAKFVWNKLKVKRVAILYVNNDYGLGLMNEFKGKFTGLGGRIVQMETYPQGARQFRKQLIKIKNADPEAIYLAGYHREMALATKQIRELGMGMQILGDADYGVSELLEMAGKHAEGAIYATPTYDPKRGTSAMKRFEVKYEEKFKSEPTVFEANGYDATQIIAIAIENGGYSGPAIAEYISKIKGYSGASGNMSFEQTGDVIKPIAIRTVKGGKFVDYK